MHVMRRLKSIASGRSSVSDPGVDSGSKRPKVEQAAKGKVLAASDSSAHAVIDHQHPLASASSVNHVGKADVENGGSIGKTNNDADMLPKEMNEMKITDDKIHPPEDKGTEAAVFSGGSTETGHIIRMTIDSDTEQGNQTISYMAERVHVPETVYRVSRNYSRINQKMPIIYVQLYTYQICRSLAYIHGVLGICHRDIKPQNLLVNPHTHQVKLCDFGSAKMLVPGEPNISYICSRYYRAPELIFGATEYTCAIDMWSVGCVFAELLLGQPLFPGESGVDQLVEIIKILGTPTREEIRCMNPDYNDSKFPHLKAHPWYKIFPKRTPPEAIDLASRLLQYSPNMRCTALEACAHPFFDDLRDPTTRLPNGCPLLPLPDFQPEELANASPELLQRLFPEHATTTTATTTATTASFPS